MEAVEIKLDIGDAIFARNHYLEGYGVIEYIAAGEIYPVQIEMNDADENGHKTFRFAFDEIFKADPGEKSAAVLDREYIAEVKYTTGRFLAGDKHIIGPCNDPRIPTHYNVYFMDHKIVATLKRDIFTIIEPYIEQSETIKDVMETKPAIIETIVQKTGVSEQLNIFDFMEG